MSRGLGHWLRAPHTFEGNLAVSAACFLIAIPMFVAVSTRSGALFLGISLAGIIRALFSEKGHS